MTNRWVLTEVTSGATWTMPINPDSMSSPHQDKAVTTAFGTKKGHDRLRTFITPSPAKEWTWGGVIRTKAHYDGLEEWAKKSGKVRVTDHLGRTFEVVMQRFAPEDRPPTAKVAWRLRYEMTVLLLRRVS